jgi:hypothetical protein
MAKDESAQSRLDDLRRRAFGPPKSDADAAEALHELQLLDVERLDIVRSGVPVERNRDGGRVARRVALPHDSNRDEDEDEDEDDGELPEAIDDAEPARSRRRPAWLIAVVVVVVLVVGGVGGYAVATTGSSALPGATVSSPTPSFTGYDPNRYAQSEPSPTGYPGDLTAAKQWLTVPEKPSDALTPNLAGLGFQSVRRVWHPFGTDAWNLWVALDSSGNDYCLIASGATTLEVQFKCVTPDAFTASGVSLDFDGNTIVWNGTLVSTTRN